MSVSPSQSIVSEFAPPNLGDATRLAGRGGWVREGKGIIAVQATTRELDLRWRSQQGLRSHDRHDNFKRQEELAIKEESGIIRALNTGGDDGGRPG